MMQKLTKRNGMLYFIVIGVVSLFWLLIRVIPKPDRITLEVFDIRGRMVEVVADGYYPAGKHLIRWEGSTLPAGNYYCRLSSAQDGFGTIEVQKLN